LVCCYADDPEKFGTVGKFVFQRNARDIRLLLLVLVHDFELGIDDVAAVALTCALFCTASWLCFRPGLRTWTRTGLC
jgi:hypothetical protein